jgi:hypothetical protein
MGFIISVAMVSTPALHAQFDRLPVPKLHHVGLNSVDPDAAIAWHLKLWLAHTAGTFGAQRS